MTSKQAMATIRGAVRTAAVFIEEFPGERLTGDWDSEAWANEPLSVTGRTDEEQAERWDLYRETLHGTIRAVVEATEPATTAGKE